MAMMSASALPLTRMHVEVSLHDEGVETHEEVMAHADVAQRVIASHLRAAKRELVRCGVNVNWDEIGGN